MNKTKKTSFWGKYFVTEAGFNLSWGSILAGVVTFFAMMMLFSLITSAIGFGALSPTSDDPLAGVGTGMIIWTIIALLLSFFAAGFVSGLSARKAGLLHGFLTWCLSLILLFALLTSAVAGVVGVVGKIVGSTLGVAGDAVSAVGDKVSEVATATFDGISDEIEKVDTKKLQANVEKVLRDTDVKELQPEYISGMLKESKDEIVSTVKEIAGNPDAAEEHLKKLGQSLKKKVETLANAVDKDAIKSAVAKNTDLSREEADKAIEEIHTKLKEATAQAKQQIEKAEKSLEKAKVELEKTIKDAREGAEDVSNGIAKYSIFMFIGLLIALCLTSFAGFIGSEKTKEIRVVQQ